MGDIVSYIYILIFLNYIFDSVIYYHRSSCVYDYEYFAELNLIKSYLTTYGILSPIFHYFFNINITKIHFLSYHTISDKTTRQKSKQFGKPLIEINFNLACLI